MSRESLNSFLERMKSDRIFAQKVVEQKDAKERMRFIEAAGYTFTPKEVGDLKEVIDDHELESITGGAMNIDKICVHNQLEIK